MEKHAETRTLRTVYSLFLGALLALFVGLGITTVHPAPEEPEAPAAVVLAQESAELTPEEEQQLIAHERDREAWEDETMAHNRDVGVAALVCAVVLLVLGLLVERRSPVLANGILFGGLFTLFHSIVRSLLSQDTVVTFVVVTVSLVLVLGLGYRRFVDRPSETGPGPDPEVQPVVTSSNGKRPSRS